MKAIRTGFVLALMISMIAVSGCGKIADKIGAVAEKSGGTEASETETASEEREVIEALLTEDSSEENASTETASTEAVSGLKRISFDPSWKYADFSKIHEGTATLYYADAPIAKGITVCINAGHGTAGGSGVKTQCHPDGSAKVTGGSTAQGSVTAAAVSGGTSMLDGTSEAKVNLKVAAAAKAALLEAGYNVLMIRETDDVQLDNIARTVIANNNADCHIAIHYDSSESDKGAFFCGVPENQTYRSMEPVASNWQKHEKLGKSMIDGFKASGIKISGSGEVPIDLTQTSYSTVPSIDLEVGDRASDHSDGAVSKIAAGIVRGINEFYML